MGFADYPFTSRYLTVDGHRLHYIDEGRGPTLLFLHGNPTSSYLWRNVIKPLTAHYRCVALDLIGFGKSDKPVAMEDYSYQAHMDWLKSMLEQLELTNITLVCQDWGSLLGLRLAAENPDRFRAIVVGNGMLPTGDQKVPKVFHLWRNFAIYSPWFPISRIVNAGSFRSLGPEERRAYDAPFPNSKYKAGARAFPRLVPISPDNPASEANRRAWQVLEQWQKPFLTTFSNGDPIMRGGDKYMQERIPGAKGQKHVTLTGGHFLQEDSPVQFARAINGLLADMGSSGGKTSG